MQLAFAIFFLLHAAAGESGACHESVPGCPEAVVLLQAKKATPATGKDGHKSPHISGVFHALLARVSLKLSKAVNLAQHDLEGSEDPIMSAEQTSIWAEIFDDVDKDHDGKITATELQSLLATFSSKPPTKAEIQDWINTVDPGGTVIDFPHFCKLMKSHVTETNTDKAIMKAFELMDTDGDGKITAAQLEKAMEYLGDEMTDEELEDMIEEAEEHGGGYINYQEFIKLMRHRDPPNP